MSTPYIVSSMLPQKNPLTMLGTIERCWLFVYRTPAAAARSLLPPELQPITYHEQAFWSVMVARARHLRPWPLPGWLGMNFWQVAYRLYVRVRPSIGLPIDGLHFMRSDCDSRVLADFGNSFTDFRFHHSCIGVDESAESVEIRVDSPHAPGYALVSRTATAELNEGSPFSSLDEAASFLRYQPFAISIQQRGRANVLRISRREQDWRFRLVQVESAHWPFLADQPVEPEICYEVAPIEYRWNRGRLIDL